MHFMGIGACVRRSPSRRRRRRKQAKFGYICTYTQSLSRDLRSSGPVERRAASRSSRHYCLLLFLTHCHWLFVSPSIHPSIPPFFFFPDAKIIVNERVGFGPGRPRRRIGFADDRRVLRSAIGHQRGTRALWRLPTLRNQPAGSHNC